jgi:hypothetical protein
MNIPVKALQTKKNGSPGLGDIRRAGHQVQLI